VDDKDVWVTRRIDAHFAQHAICVGLQLVAAAILRRREHDVMKCRRRAVRREPSHGGKSVGRIVGGHTDDSSDVNRFVIIGSQNVSGETPRVEVTASVPDVNNDHGGPSAASRASIASRPARIDVSAVPSTDPPEFSERAI